MNISRAIVMGCRGAVVSYKFSVAHNPEQHDISLVNDSHERLKLCRIEADSDYI